MATAKKTAKKTAKPAAKKAPAKSLAKTSKKLAAKKTAAKQTAAKKAAPAKKTAVKKPALKAVPAKKAPVKKTVEAAPAGPAKKAPVKTIAGKSAMGRGLEALLSTEGIPENKRDSVVELKINDISPNNGQPRKTFNDDALNELASSIEENGVIQPIIVQRKGDGYRIVAGERRWRAARIAGLSVIPAIVRDLSDRETMEQALIENIQREDLNPIEEAIAYKTLLEKYNLKHEQVAEIVSKSRTTISNSLRLLNLCEDVQRMLIDEMLSQGHARALLAITDPEQQYSVAQRVFDENLSVRDIEKIVKELSKAKKEKQVNKLDNEFIYKDFEEKIKNNLGTKVIIKPKDNNKGKIEIEYYTQNEFERIALLLTNVQG